MKQSREAGDMNQHMHAAVQEAAGPSDEPQAPEKDPAAVQRGRGRGESRAPALGTRATARDCTHGC